MLITLIIFLTNYRSININYDWSRKVETKILRKPNQIFQFVHKNNTFLIIFFIYIFWYYHDVFQIYIIYIKIYIHKFLSGLSIQN